MEIKDYPNYLLFRNGAILSKTRKKFLKPSPNIIEEYLKVNLCKNGHPRTFHIHRLLATHFIPNPKQLPCVDHIDRNKINNNLENLRWASKAQNSHNRGINSRNTSGYQHIKMRQPSKSYIFQIMRYGKGHSKTFKTLEEAIEYKKEYFKDNPDF